MVQRIQILRGSTGEWTTDDVVLLLGELGTDTTTGIVKIGDGTSTWSALDGTTLLPATTTAVGGVELATDAETIAGTDTERAVTPASGAAAYVALGDEGTVVAVANYAAGWPARPTADLVFWLATDVAATTPGAATGDDIVILAQDSDLTAIAALTTTAYGRALLELVDIAGLQAVLGPTGTPSDTTYLRGDGSWQTVSGGDTGTLIDGGSFDSTYGGVAAIDGGSF